MLFKNKEKISKKVGFLLVLCLLMMNTMSFASPATGEDLSNSHETHNHETELSLDQTKVNKGDTKEDKKTMIIESEDDLLNINTSDDNIDTYIIKKDDGVTIESICTECGYNGLDIVDIFDQYAVASIACPIQGYPSGNCILTHFKVYSGVRCSYCDYEDIVFQYDKVKSTCYNDGGGTNWIIPDKTHEDGIDVHSCIHSECTNVYFYFSDIEDLQ